MPRHEMEYETFPSQGYFDLMPYQYGREVCEPGHAFGPARRSHYLFHYVISGKGTLVSFDEGGSPTEYHLTGGHGFLIVPSQVNTYVADLDEPWEYIWVEFDGVRVRESLEHVGLTQSSPIYTPRAGELRDKMVDEMRYLIGHADASTFHLVGHAYLFFDYLLQSTEVPRVPASSKLQEFYIRQALDFVEQNYQKDISVDDIARQTGLNRSYFGKVFKAALDKSPQQYLIGYRMARAAELLKLTALSVGDVGRAVGYPNQLHFSRAFKTAYGASPRDWRRENARS